MSSSTEALTILGGQTLDLRGFAAAFESATPAERIRITESIDDHMPEGDRPIPFQNIIYVGDGMTDVPSMALTKKSGGHTVAVYDRRGKGRAVCQKLLHAGRADFIAPADYRDGSRLARRVELLLDAIIAGVAYRREAFRCLQENRAGA